MTQIGFAGMQKVSFVDFPKTICTTVFTQGCNMKCGFCHNPELVFVKEKPKLRSDDVFAHLQARKDQIEGVCITGGEPTLHKSLIDFIREVKKLGLKVKLDTNGTNPQMLKQLLDEQLLDYVAMDVKSSIAEYAFVSGLNPSLVPNILTSIQLLMSSRIDYEFRTTLVRSMHDEHKLVDILRLIAGAKRYILQRSRNEYAWSDEVKKVPNFTDSQMQAFVDYIRPHFTGELSWR